MELLIDLGYGLAFVAGTIAISIGTYLIARRISGEPSERHKEMAGAMVARIGALHVLIIALVFAQEMAAYQRLEAQTASEASAIADVYNDAKRYDAVALKPLQAARSDYLRIVLDTEWAKLGRGEGLEATAWSSWDLAYNTVLDLAPQKPRQISLREHMLASLHSISASRDMRESEASTSVAGFFWLAALSGVILIAIGYYIYPPERQNLVLLALFSAYTGAILFLIFGFSNTYSPPIGLPPAPPQTLAANILAGTS